MTGCLVAMAHVATEKKRRLRLLHSLVLVEDSQEQLLKD